MVKLFPAFISLFISGNLYSQLHLEGSLHNSGGVAISYGHVHISRLTSSKLPAYNFGDSVWSFQTDNKGNFKISIKEEGPFHIQFSSPGHQLLNTIVYKARFEGRVAAYLMPYTFDMTDDYFAVSSATNYNRADAIEFTKNGKFISCKIPAADSGINYQLLNNTKRFGFVPFRSSTVLHKKLPAPYDGYINFGKPEKGKDFIEIKLDLDKLNSNSSAGLRNPYVEFSDKEVTKAAMFVIRSDDALRIYRKNTDTSKKFLFNEWTRLEQEILNETNNDLKKIALISYRHAIVHGTEAGYSYNENLRKLAYTFIEPESVFWGICPGEVNKFSCARNPDVPREERISCLKEVISYLSKVADKTSITELRGFSIVNICSGSASSAIQDWETFDKYFNLLKETDPQSRFINLIAGFDARNNRIKRGGQLPEFNIRSVVDTSVFITNEKLKGKLTLIDLWATWCAPCVAEIPNMKAVYEKYKNKGFEILSIAIDDEYFRIPEFFKKRTELQFPWLHGYVLGGFKSEFAKLFEVNAIPKPILISESGKILALSGELRGENLEKTIERFLAASN